MIVVRGCRRIRHHVEGVGAAEHVTRIGLEHALLQWATSGTLEHHLLLCRMEASSLVQMVDTSTWSGDGTPEVAAYVRLVLRRRSDLHLQVS